MAYLNLNTVNKLLTHNYVYATQTFDTAEFSNELWGHAPEYFKGNMPRVFTIVFTIHNMD